MSGVAEHHFGSLLALGRPDGGPKLSLAGFAFSLVGRRLHFLSQVCFKYIFNLFVLQIDGNKIGSVQARPGPKKENMRKTSPEMPGPPNQYSQSLFSLRVSGDI